MKIPNYSFFWIKRKSWGVYIIQSLADKSYYKGFTENPLRRLVQHNNGESIYTSTKLPWCFVYIE
ncbi:GIY-YIG nuclease family protein [Pedobacter psychrodurus]|uniref:GIY-YIG nuclease family protein n=1 Tax=Pedobacter psychrodurus TaxID=2530456 RepID=UPI00397759DC